MDVSLNLVAVEHQIFENALATIINNNIVDSIVESTENVKRKWSRAPKRRREISFHEFGA